MSHEFPQAGSEVRLLGAPNDNAAERRFSFGKNWASFLRVLTEERIVEAERSLRDMLGPERIAGSSFLDVGCGSGLFSLAAMRSGASRVHSFDMDEDSVACARELRQRYFPDSPRWTVERASVLDDGYLTSLGQWELVYSWGVLHHTGRMWAAIDGVTKLVGPGGLLFISIYNDQGRRSDAWTTVKRIYNRDRLGKVVVLSMFVPYFAARNLVVDAIRLRNPRTRYHSYMRSRGMSVVHDWIDWLGGYPFEVAKPEEVFDFCMDRGLTLQKLITKGGTLACNEFVFRRP